MNTDKINFEKRDSEESLTNQEGQKQELKLDSVWQKILLSESDLISTDKLKSLKSVKVFEPIGEKTATLRPLFYMPNLTQLTITRSYTLPVSFKMLANLSMLEDLRIATCDVKDLDYLKELHQLQTLNISQIKIKTAVLKYINNLEKLKNLNVANTGLRSMKIFQNNNVIEKLICSYSKGIRNMANLKSLFLLLRDQVDIEGCPKLQYLRIGNARKISNVDNLANLNQLLKLEIHNSRNKINLSSLYKLNKLEELFLDSKLELATMSKPMESVKRLTVTENNRAKFIEQNL